MNVTMNASLVSTTPAEPWSAAARGPDLGRVTWVTSIVSISVGVLGLLGNALCARLMTTTPMLPYSCAIFLVCLAASDSVVIFFEIIDDIAVHIDGWDEDSILYAGNEWRCRVGVFFHEVCRVVSAWLVVAMAAELCIVVGDRDKAAVVYTRNRAFYISMAVGLLALAGCFPFLVIIGGTDHGECNSTYLVFTELYSDVVLHIFNNSLLPSVLILVTNARSIYCIINKKPDSQEEYVCPIDRGPKQKKSPFQMKNAILTVSFFYVLTVMPLTVLDIGIFLNRVVPSMTYNKHAWDVAHTICRCWLVFNYSLKLYLIGLFEPQVNKSFSYMSQCGMIVSASTQGRQSKYVVPASRRSKIASQRRKSHRHTNGGTHAEMRF